MVQPANPIDRLNSSPEALLADAESKPPFQDEQREAKERRIAQLVWEPWLGLMWCIC